MSLYYRYNLQYITIQGQTYPHRVSIKSLGGRFVGGEKVWQIPYKDEILKKVAAMCHENGGGPLQAPRSGPSPAGPEENLPRNAVKPPDELAPDTLTIKDLLQKVNRVLQHAFPSAVWIVGEIQNFQKREKACYFDLAEPDADMASQGTMTIKALLWTSTWQKLLRVHGEENFHAIFQNELKVRVYCQVNFYQSRGQISLNVLNVDPNYTKGLLAMAREKLLKELRQKGLDKKNKQAFFPYLPLRVGLLCADGSRAQSDFIHQLSQGAFAGTLISISCNMQGESSQKQLKHGLRQLAKEHCDLIVITRGGGSAADLRWFDGAEIAYAIAHSPVPVVAAIGHHEDYCIAEEICFRREKTPTAAADFINSCFQNVGIRLEQWVHNLELRLGQYMRTYQELGLKYAEVLYRQASEQIAAEQNRLLTKIHSLDRNANMACNALESHLLQYSQKIPTQAQEECNRYLRDCESRLLPQWKLKIQEKQNQWEFFIESLEHKISSRNPIPWLKKGWTRLEGASGSITSLAQCSEQERLKARLLDGILELSLVKKTQLTHILEKDATHEHDEP